ncbi:MAG: hypothetical protein RLZ98_906 [Pseudomonadota bacterium]|jgi:membrane protease subunit HflK
MSWNNQNGGGGWKSGGGGGGGGPWGQGPWGQGGGGGNQQPDLEEILKRSQDRIKQVTGSGLPGPLMFLIALVGAAVLAFFAFTFTVKPDELGVVLRFGKYDRVESQGLHFRWPYPVEEVRLPKVTRENSIEIGMRTTGADRFTSTPTRYRDSGSVQDVAEESLMLTGDENIVDVDFVVFWRIKPERDPQTGALGAVQYLFNIQNPERTVKEVAESAMREVVGQNDIQPILTEARQKTEQAVQELMQKTLDDYKAGILVSRVQLQKVDPPGKVIDAFRDVQAARADQERLQNEARSYANRIVPEARGEAERILQAAEGYRQQTIAEAIGQADRFKKVYDEYRKAPDVTRQRIYLETMERVFGGTDKIILDSSGGGQGVVPYLPLNELQKSSKQTTGAQ